MNNHGRFSWRINATVSTLVLVMGAAAFGASPVAAESQSTFGQLQDLRRKAQHHRREATRTREALERIERQLQTAPTDRNLDRRVERKLRHRATRQFAEWSRLYRAVRRRAPIWEPGRGSDLRRLLVAVETAVLRDRRELYESLGRLRGRTLRTALGVGARTQRTVELAQHRASDEAAQREREQLLARKRDDSGLDEELREAQKRLERRLQQLLDRETGEDFHRKKGSLRPPVDATPEQGFGKVKQDDSMTYVRHTGLTYRVDPGTAVDAVAEGVVVYAQEFQGYGRLVIVDHGDEYHSLYAHLDEIAVREGETIEGGDRIGASGATGSLDGPKLYFELRHDETPVDPEPWFVRPKEE